MPVWLKKVSNKKEIKIKRTKTGRTRKRRWIEILKISRDEKLRKSIGISYFDQHGDLFTDHKSIKENMIPSGGDYIDVNGKRIHICGYLKNFLFNPSDIANKVSTLSGGQRNRLLLAKILAKPNQLMILDEPTNDLDTETLDILIDFIKLMNMKYKDFVFVFHSTLENINFITEKLEKSNLDNCDIVVDKDIKSEVLLNSIFAVSKSGTVSLEICNAKVPSIIIYKINYVNYLIMKSLVKVKFANIINIINKREVIPELLQNECNAKEIYKSTVYFLKNPKFAQNQVEECSKTLDQIRPLSSSSEEAAKVLNKYLIS